MTTSKAQKPEEPKRTEDQAPATGQDQAKGEPTSPEEAAKHEGAAEPIVGTDNPEGIDLSAGAKDAATAYEEE